MPSPDPGVGASSFLACPRCGLSITMKAWWSSIGYWPRYIARARIAAKLFSSGRPAAELYGDGLVPRADGEAVRNAVEAT